MSARTIRAGVIGLGVGERHLASYQAIEGCEVAAICDLDSDKLAEIGERHHVSHRHTDWRKITEHPDIDVVSICSYDDCHAEQAISAFRHGKHVMVEKPLALRKEDAERVARAMQDADRFLTSNLILRHSPRFKALKQMIDRDEFGDIFYLEGDYIHQILWKVTEGWRGRMEPYCVTYGGGIHLVDLIVWLMGGQKVVEVCGMGNKMLSAGSQFPYPDTIANLMTFEGGALAKTTTMFGPQRTHFHALNVYGTKRTFINDIPHAKLFTGDQPEDEEEMTVPYPAYEKGDLLPEFIDSIRSGRQPLVTARDVFRVMDICFAAWDSVRRKQTVAVSYIL